MSQDNLSLSHGVGNTRNPVRSRHYMLTICNYNIDDSDKVKNFFEKYIFQAEVGELGTPHLQIYGCFKHQRRLSNIKKHFPRAHIEVVNNVQAARDYCRKTESRIDGPWIKGFRKPLRILKPEAFYDWQQRVIELIESPCDDRTIRWFWEPLGNRGKTQLVKYICEKYNALYLNGSASNIKCGIVKHFENDECNQDDLICIFGFPRSMEGRVSYKALEEVKDGLFFSGKYESGMVNFNSPHVIVFANFRPDEDLLSKDRWIIEKL